MTKMSSGRKTNKGIGIPIHLDPSDSDSVQIIKQNEVWSEYELADGNTVRMKPLVMEIRKSRKKAPDGNHQYHFRSSLVIDVKVHAKSAKGKD